MPDYQQAAETGLRELRKINRFPNTKGLVENVERVCKLAFDYNEVPARIIEQSDHVRSICGRLDDALRQLDDMLDEEEAKRRPPVEVPGPNLTPRTSAEKPGESRE